MPLRRGEPHLCLWGGCPCWLSKGPMPPSTSCPLKDELLLMVPLFRSSLATQISPRPSLSCVPLSHSCAYVVCSASWLS